MPKCTHAAERRQRRVHTQRLDEIVAMQGARLDEALRRARERLTWPPIEDPWEGLSASAPACETGAFRVNVTIAPGNSAWARMRARLLSLGLL